MAIRLRRIQAEEVTAYQNGSLRVWLDEGWVFYIINTSPVFAVKEEGAIFIGGKDLDDLYGALVAYYVGQLVKDLPLDE